MTLAIMQPYVFPYIGYFQLIAAVDKFVVYDDVSFIKQGWINRNKILVNSKECTFTIPLNGSSSNILIKDIEVNKSLYLRWRDKFYKTLNQDYKKAPFYNQGIELVEQVLDANHHTISDLAKESIIKTTELLGLKTKFVRSSTIYNNIELKGQSRIIDICEREGAKRYINAIGGRELYSKEAFSHKNIQLSFLKPGKSEYVQSSEPFVPWLSIIDVVMYNSVEEANRMLNNYELI